MMAFVSSSSIAPFGTACASASSTVPTRPFLIQPSLWVRPPQSLQCAGIASGKPSEPHHPRLSRERLGRQTVAWPDIHIIGDVLGQRELILCSHLNDPQLLV